MMSANHSFRNSVWTRVECNNLMDWILFSFEISESARHFFQTNQSSSSKKSYLAQNQSAILLKTSQPFCSKQVLHFAKNKFAILLKINPPIYSESFSHYVRTSPPSCQNQSAILSEPVHHFPQNQSAKWADVYSASPESHLLSTVLVLCIYLDRGPPILLFLTMRPDRFDLLDSGPWRSRSRSFEAAYSSVAKSSVFWTSTWSSRVGWWSMSYSTTILQPEEKFVNL